MLTILPKVDRPWCGARWRGGGHAGEGEAQPAAVFDKAVTVLEARIIDNNCKRVYEAIAKRIIDFANLGELDFYRLRLHAVARGRAVLT